MITGSSRSVDRRLLFAGRASTRLMSHVIFWAIFIGYHMIFFLPIFPERVYSSDTRVAYLLYYARFIPIYYLSLMGLSLIGQPSMSWLSPLIVLLICLATTHLITKPLYHFYDHQFGLENLPPNFKPIGNYYLKGWLPTRKTDFYVFVYDLMDMQLLALPVGLKWLRLGATAELKSAQLEEQKLHDELDGLKAQLDSHFVLNVINAATVEVEAYSEKASQYLTEAADLIGFTLYEARSEFVNLQIELEFISKYLNLEAMRTNQRSKIIFDLQGQTPAQGRVPTLIITTLVENAVKHGVHATHEPSYVRISCLIQSDHFTIQVFNTKQAKHSAGSTENSRKGLGLANLRKRLEAYFPGKYQLQITERPKSYLVYLKFPLLP